MSYFKQAVRMMLVDHQVICSVAVLDHLTDVLTSPTIEEEAKRASDVASLKQGLEGTKMSDLFMIVHGDEDDVNTLNNLYPALDNALEKLWELIDSDYIDKWEWEKANVPHTK